MNRLVSSMQNNDAKSPACWEMQQQEIITIAFFPSEPLALGSVDEDSVGEITHHRMQAHKETLFFEESDRKCKNAAYVADAHVCSAVYMHSWPPYISNSPKEPLVLKSRKSERVRKHVAH